MFDRKVKELGKSTKKRNKGGVFLKGRRQGKKKIGAVAG